MVRQQGRYLAKGSLLELVLYVWKELRAAGLFCLCFLVFMKLEQLQSESSGDKEWEGSGR